MKQITRIVCTGGPCSGKTTFMTRVQEIFAERGYRILVDHEAATDLITGGISPATMGMYEFQKYCIGLQLKKEELFEKAANNIEGDKVLIFFDRGILDDKGYVTPDEFTELLKGFDKTEDECRNYYDLVMHLTTSAKGAEEAYTFANNAARYESVEEARIVDDTILESWSKHPNRVIIGNETDFETKMYNAVQAVFQFLGQGNQIETHKKYLVEVTPELIARMEEIKYSKTHIIQHFLKSESGIEKRIRRREKEDGSILYYYSEATMMSPNSRIKRDRIISERTYKDYSIAIDPMLSVIDKERYGFIYDNAYFKLDIFSFDKTKGLLSVQDNNDARIPEFFNVIKDVSDVVNYKNYYLAKTQKF